jgi:hypothetical protein
VSEIEDARAPDGTHLAFGVLEAAPDRGATNAVAMASGGLIPMIFVVDRGAVSRSRSGHRVQ